MSARLRLLWLLLALLAAAPAFADYRTRYIDGRDAAKRGDWAKARQQMQGAIAERADPAARARLAGNFQEPYVPHYYLGLASAKLGDCAGAVKAFEHPASKSVVAGLPDLASVQAAELLKCRTLLAQGDKPTGGETTPPIVAQQDKPPPATPGTPPPAKALPDTSLAPVRNALTRLDGKLGAIETRLRKPPLAGSGDARALERTLAQLKKGRQQAGADLERARSAGDAALLTRVTDQGKRLDTELAALGESVDAAAEGLEQALAARTLENKRNSIDGVLATLTARQKAATTAGIGADAAAQRSAATQAQALQAARGASDLPSLDRALGDAARAIKDLDSAIAAAPKPAPEALRALARSYFGADYASAAAWNQEAALAGDARARAQALLLRAAARWQVYMRGGAQDRALAAQVDTDLRAARRLDAGLQPSELAFSPKLIARFRTL